MNEQPKNDPKNYSDLISEIQKGEIKIPKFQRSFVRSIDQTAKLLDSIVKGYPIGTFVMRKTSERLYNIKNIGNSKLPETPEGVKVQYVLDGQQRMTSLYAAYCGAEIQKEGEKKITDYKEIYVNLDIDINTTEDQIIVSEKPLGNHISLYKILNSDDYYNEIQEYGQFYGQKINQYKLIFQTYQFSTIVLRKEDILSAIEVFTRINTGGKPLSLFEIMSAKTYDETQSFDMQKKFDELLNDLSNCKYETISSSVILNILSLTLSKTKECKSKTILQLDKQEIINTRNDIISAVKESIDYFRSVYRIPVSSILPYDSLIVPFAYFFHNQKGNPSFNQAKYLEEFFWRASLSSRYSNSTDSNLAQDIKRIDEILNNNRPNYDFKIFLSKKDLIETNFSAGSSYCKAILCLLSYHEPKDFQTNGKVILDNSFLKLANSKNYHHFFPKSFLNKNNISNENSLMNITLISDKLNKNIIRAKQPSVYIQDFLDDNSELEYTLESHLIGNLGSSGILNDDYSLFLSQRAERIYKELNDRINLNNTEKEKNREIKDILDAGENDKIEFKSTLHFDINQNIVNNKLEYVVAKTIAAFLNTEGGNLFIGVDDEGNSVGIDRDIETLQKKNIDGFQLHLSQVIKKFLGDYFESYLKITFPEIDNKIVCMINISKSGKPVFVNFEGREDFFVRNGNSSIPKNRKEQSEYEKIHWS